MPHGLIQWIYIAGRMKVKVVLGRLNVIPEHMTVMKGAPAARPRIAPDGKVTSFITFCMHSVDTKYWQPRHVPLYVTDKVC